VPVLEAQFLLWQLADSAFPTGGFAHSLGLESAWQHGEVRNCDELKSFVEATLWQAGRAALPFVTAAHSDPLRVAALDDLCEAFTTNHVANRASRTQGRALLTAARRVFPDRVSPEPVLEHTHVAPVFGMVTRCLEVSLETTTQLFLFGQLRGVLAAAVRLNIVGPMEAQRVQNSLAATAAAVVEQCRSLTIEDIAQSAPLLEIWQSAHDRLYSRLFQS